MSPRLSVYVAASSKELERAKWVMREIEALGHKITHNWVRCVEEEGEANPSEATLSQCERWAWDDLLGVENSDVLLLLIPDDPSFGMGVELGYAIGSEYDGKIVVSGPNRKSIFTALADAFYGNDAEAIQAEFRYGF